MKNNEGHKDILKIKAKEDLDAAKKLAGIPDSSEEIVLFHCQQAIEKALKAFLDANGIVYPKTHDLELLLSLCIKKDASFNQISNITAFTPYAVEIRYDEVIEVARSEVEELLNQTEQAVEFILNKV